MPGARVRSGAGARAGAQAAAKAKGKGKAAQRTEAIDRIYHRTAGLLEDDSYPPIPSEVDDAGCDGEDREEQTDQDEGDDLRASDRRERDPFRSLDPALSAMTYVVWLWRPPVLLWSVDAPGQWRCSKKRENVRRRLEKLFATVQRENRPFLRSPRDLEGVLAQEWFSQEDQGEEDQEASLPQEGNREKSGAPGNLVSYTLKDLSIFLCRKDGTPEENPWLPVGNLFSGQGQRINHLPVALEVRWLEEALRQRKKGLSEVMDRSFWKENEEWLVKDHGDFRGEVAHVLKEGLGLDAALDLSVTVSTLQKNRLSDWRNFLETRGGAQTPGGNA